MNPETNTSNLRSRLAQDGFVVVREFLDGETLAVLCAEFSETARPRRNLLSMPSIRDLACAPAVRRLMEAALGPRCFAVRGTLFNKTPNANWKVAWHQDLTIAVRERREVAGFGPWTTKGDVPHVQPAESVMSSMLSLRLHLDDSDPDNGPLRAIPGTHMKGRLSASQLAVHSKAEAVTCLVPRGGALLMKPLLLHASSACTTSKSRRVIHLDYAVQELPNGLEWNERVAPV